MNKEETYLPLAHGLEINRSKIHGHGLFASRHISADTDLGVSHIMVGENLVRTPLGGFYNHSENPNCVKVKVGETWRLMTLKAITPGEEITVKYTFYKIK